MHGCRRIDRWPWSLVRKHLRSRSKTSCAAGGWGLAGWLVTISRISPLARSRYTHTHVYIYIYIYLYTYTSIYIYTYIYIFMYIQIPVVPHKAVAEVSKTGNLWERLVVVNQGWQSEATDGLKGGWGLLSFPLFLWLLTIYLPTYLSMYVFIYRSLSLSLPLPLPLPLSLSLSLSLFLSLSLSLSLPLLSFI